MRRKITLFVCLVIGLSVGLGLVWRGKQNHKPPHEVTDNHGTPLLFAMMQGDTSEAMRLLQKGANPEEADHLGRTPLMVAAQEGNVELVQRLLEVGAHVDATDKSGHTALLLAIGQSHSIPISMLLLTHGADAGHQDNDGETPLLAACTSTSLTDTIFLESLLTHGAKVNTPNHLGTTALMRVASGASTALRSLGKEVPAKLGSTSQVGPPRIQMRVLELLLEHGADVKVSDKNGMTALTYASGNAPKEGIQILLKHGANPNTVGTDITHIPETFFNGLKVHPARTVEKKVTPLKNAMASGLMENIKLLLASGAKPQPNEFSIGLNGAISHENFAEMKFMIDHGANVNYCDPATGATPLLSALNRSNVQITKFMIDRGANVNYCYPSTGETPLMSALRRSDVQIAKVLMQHGADPKVRDKNGKTALDYAPKVYRADIGKQLFGDKVAEKAL
jgi:ankyrin repeat protein